MQTNLIIKAKHYDHVSPLITIEMEMKDYSEAEDIASKLNDIAKARGEDTVTYYVQATKLPVDSVKDTSNDDDIPF